MENDYLLQLDDDIVFNYDVLKGLEEDMEANKSFGWISSSVDDLSLGKVTSYAANWVVKGNKIEQKRVELKDMEGLTEVDRPYLSSIYRKEIFKDVLWDEDIKIGREHFLFALELKDKKWRTGVDPNLRIQHGGCPYSPTYQNMRNRIEEAEKVVKEKLDGMEVV